MAARIVELLIGQRLTPAEISQQLAKQDGTQMSAEEVAAYLEQAQLAGYTGSPFRDEALPGVGEAELGTFTRYAVHLLHIPALNALGYERVMPLVDVTKPTTRYSHLLRC